MERIRASFARRRLHISSRQLLVFVIVLATLSSAVLASMVCLSVMSDYSSFVRLEPDNDFFQQLTGNHRLTEIYLFNWTNPKSFIQNTSIKPAFTEVGPFVFEEKLDFVNSTYGNTVKFSIRRTWRLVPEESLPLNTRIVNLNIVAAVAAYMFRYQPEGKGRLELQHFLNGKEGLVTNLTAGELLFNGYFDSALKNINILFNHSVPFDKFGWFYGRNSTTSGVYQFTRNGNFLNYTGSGCASAGPLVSSSFLPRYYGSKMSVFRSDICWHFRYDFFGDIPITVNGWRGSKFTASSTSLNPNHGCFSPDCTPLPPGTLNLSFCYHGLPFYFSYPHFLLADGSYVSAVTGLKPSKLRHESYVLFDKQKKLVPMEVRNTHQLNILIEKLPWVDMFSNLTSSLLVPMIWYRETWRVDDSMTATLISKSAMAFVAVALVPLLIAFTCGTILTINSYRRRLSYGIPTSDARVSLLHSDDAAAGVQ